MTLKRARLRFFGRIWRSARRKSTSKLKNVSTLKMNSISTTTSRNSSNEAISCTAPMPPSNPFLDIPPELYMMVFDHLDYECLLKLGATSKHFHSIVSREKVVAALYRKEDAIPDPSRIRNEKIACFQCYRLRSAYFDFDERGIQPKYLADGEQAGRRRCLICLMPSSPLVKEKRDKRSAETPDRGQPDKQP
ncbi:hypothetical protein GJ744_003227 [Endocarpon pusillum]|uniref:F-box domain-containing protein n=1 Tax=Endocarpon pusillum TaxID=364733 RepID=A0A8H7A9Z2_9EURO|nr:hypothetical protein GJ744_003227 [Endocarpon pusillum]